MLIRATLKTFTYLQLHISSEGFMSQPPNEAPDAPNRARGRGRPRITESGGSKTVVQLPLNNDEELALHALQTTCKHLFNCNCKGQSCSVATHAFRYVNV